MSRIPPILSGGLSSAWDVVTESASSEAAAAKTIRFIQSSRWACRTARLPLVRLDAIMPHGLRCSKRAARHGASGFRMAATSFRKVERAGTAAALPSALAASQQGKLRHSVVVERLDGAIKLACAIAHPWLGVGAIDPWQARIRRYRGFRLMGNEVDAEPPQTRTGQFTEHLRNEPFPGFAGAADIHIHDSACHRVGRHARNGASNREASIGRREAAPRSPDHGA